MRFVVDLRHNNRLRLPRSRSPVRACMYGTGQRGTVVSDRVNKWTIKTSARVWGTRTNVIVGNAFPAALPLRRTRFRFIYTDETARMIAVVSVRQSIRGILYDYFVHPSFLPRGNGGTALPPRPWILSMMNVSLVSCPRPIVILRYTTTIPFDTVEHSVMLKYFVPPGGWFTEVWILF